MAKETIDNGEGGLSVRNKLNGMFSELYGLIASFVSGLGNKVDKETGKSLVLDTEIAKIHAAGSDNQDLSGLVEKETGKSLVLDTEIAKIHAAGSDDQDLSGLVEKETGKSLVLDTEIAKIHAAGSDDETTNSILQKIGDGSKISSQYLPSYVDDVIEGIYVNETIFTVEGEAVSLESGKIYISTDSNKQYRWTGTVLVFISNPLSYATQSEAESNLENTRVMTALRVFQNFVHNIVDYAFNSLNTTTKTIIGAINEVFDVVSGKQDALIDGTNIKTLNDESLLGEGNIAFTASNGITKIENNSILGGIIDLNTSLSKKDGVDFNIKNFVAINIEELSFIDGSDSYHFLNNSVYVSVYTESGLRLMRYSYDGMQYEEFTSIMKGHIGQKAIKEVGDSLIIVGSFYDEDDLFFSNILKINKYTGIIDEEFITNLGSGFSINNNQTTLHGVILLSNGKLIITGNFDSLNGNYIREVVCLNVDGTVDNDYQPSGIAGIYFFSYALECSNGNIVVYGWSNPINLSIRMYYPDGSQCSSFNTTNIVNGYITDVVQQADGKLIIIGQFTQAKGVACGRIARLNMDGSLDGSFNTGGSGFNWDNNKDINSISLRDNGDIVVAGGFSSYNGQSVSLLARIDSNGTLLQNFIFTGISANYSRILFEHKDIMIFEGTLDSSNYVKMFILDDNGNEVGGIIKSSTIIAEYGLEYEKDYSPNYKDRSLVDKAFVMSVIEKNILVISEDTTLELSHKNKIIEASGIITITLPNLMPVGYTVDITNIGTGIITLAATGTLSSKLGHNKLSAQWTGASAYHRGNNEWVIVGDLTS